MNTIISLDVTHKYHDVYTVTQLFSNAVESVNSHFKLIEVDFIHDTINKEQIFNASGVIISGSKYSVNDNLDWIEDARMLIRDLDKKDIPVLGICFGHQLIATAFGGQVVRMKKHNNNYYMYCI